MIECKDWLGNDIRVGSQVVYPVRQGSSLHLVHAAVKEIGEGKLIVTVIKDQWGWTERAERTLTRLDRVTALS